MKKTIFTILFFSLALSGCSLNGEKDQDKDQKASLANPASVFCVEQGGELKIRDSEDGGQYGVCVFSDGSECEEWAFFRLECKPGSEVKVESEEGESKDKETDTPPTPSQEEISNVGKDSIKVFDIKSGDIITSPVTIKGEGRAFENNLIVELRNNNRDALVREHSTIKSGEVGEIGPFEITLNFNFTNTKEGFVVVYEESAKDGSELNLVEIPVKFNNKENDL